MKLNILKRAGMLAASTAVCCGVVFGGLSMNGLRYVRPTAENWTLLAYMQPAARIEQQKTTRVIPDEKEWSYLRITGYDAQNREIWSLNCKRPFGVSSSERKVYSGSQMTWYSTTCGVKTVSYTEYDEQGRIIRTENANGTPIAETRKNRIWSRAATRQATYSHRQCRNTIPKPEKRPEPVRFSRVC